MGANVNIIDVRHDLPDADAPWIVPRTAREVVTVSSSGPFGTRFLDEYRLSTNLRRSQRILWRRSDIEDTYGRDGFCRVAWCARQGVTAAEAAARLLRGYWRHIRSDLPFPQELASGSLVDEHEVRNIIADVWQTDATA